MANCYNTVTRENVNDTVTASGFLETLVSESVGIYSWIKEG